jgi:hypothetical protein
VDETSAHEIRGRGECRAPNAPAASRANLIKHTSVVTTGPPDTRHSRTQWFYGLLRALPGDQALLSPSFADMVLSAPGRADLPPRNLTPALGRQNHTTSPSASAPFVCAPAIAHGSINPPCHHFVRAGTAASTASHPASVTIAIRPSVGQDGLDMHLIWVKPETKYFCKSTLTKPWCIRCVASP